MKIFGLVIMVLGFSIFTPDSAMTQNLPTKKPSNLVPEQSIKGIAGSEINIISALREDVKQLKLMVQSQREHIIAQKAALEAYQEKTDKNSNLPWITFLTAIIAAVIGGLVTLLNQKKQAEDNKYIKAIELIMASPNGYQANIKANSLKDLLNNKAQEHVVKLADPANFQGAEYTELQIALAQAMSAKAATPQEVLEIWRIALPGKPYFSSIEY